METKITLDMLTQDGVSVKSQQYAVIEGTEYAIGDPHRKAYVNSERGRLELAELPEAHQNAILAIWGETPTVIEEVYEEETEETIED